MLGGTGVPLSHDVLRNECLHGCVELNDWSLRKDKKSGRLARAAVHAPVSISAKRPADTGRLK